MIFSCIKDWYKFLKQSYFTHSMRNIRKNITYNPLLLFANQCIEKNKIETKVSESYKSLERWSARKTFSSIDFKLRSPKVMNNKQSSLNRAHVCIGSRRTSGFSLKIFWGFFLQKCSGRKRSSNLFPEFVWSDCKVNTRSTRISNDRIAFGISSLTFIPLLRFCFQEGSSSVFYGRKLWKLEFRICSLHKM